jgi:plasmid maintenance system antidote protein VapI
MRQTVADMLAGLGLTHDAIAARVGVSRQQVTNVIAGRFGVSRPIARRVLELARAA